MLLLSSVGGCFLLCFLLPAVQSWHIRMSPRNGAVSVTSGQGARLACACTFTGLDIDTQKIQVNWYDFNIGNLIYSSSLRYYNDPNIKVTINRSMDRITTSLTYTRLVSKGNDDQRTIECGYTLKNQKNANSRFVINVLPAPSTTPPTTQIPTTTKGYKPPRKRWTKRHCNAARKAGYDVCVRGAKCFDDGSSYICKCAEGTSGSGLLQGVCARIPESVRLNSVGGAWKCPVENERVVFGCVSTKMKKMKEDLQKMNLKGQLESVKNFSSQSAMSVDELLEMGEVMSFVVEGMENDMEHKKQFAINNPKMTTNMVINSTSNLLARRDLWKSLPSSLERRKLATTFTNLVTRTAIASTDGLNANLTIDDSLIDLQVVPVTSSSSKLQFRPGGLKGDAVDIELKSVTNRAVSYSRVERPRLVFTRFRALREDLEDNPGGNSSELKVLSDVISATSTKVGMVKKIRFHLLHESIKKIENGSNAMRRCAYWNEKNFSWAFDGCRIVNVTNPALTSCECDHLTSFAVLLDFRNVTMGLTAEHNLALSIITYVGCCLSIFCCIFGVWTYDILRRSKGDRMNSEGRTSFFIYEMICFSLLVAQTIFLMGIFHTDTLILCRIVAALLHYFFLLLFEWMLMAGVYYILVYTQPYSIATVDANRRWLVAIIFLAPAIIVGVSLGLRMDGYGTPAYCWLSVADGLIWAFVGPVTAMLAINMILLSVLIVLTWRIKPSDMLETGEVNKTWVTTRALKLRYELLFCIVLGATWIFGYFLIENTSSLVFSYIFAVLNSLQGVFILISYANWSRIRAAYIAEFRRKRWLPESFRRWLHSRQYSPGGPPGAGLAGSSGTPSQRRTTSRASNSQRGLLTGSAGPPGSDSGQLSRTTRSTRLGSGSSGPGKWSVSAGTGHGLDADENSVAMVTETEAAFNENYLGHSMMDEPRQTYVDFDERFVSQSDAEIINMTAAMPLRAHEEDGEHHYSTSSSSSSSSVASMASTPPSSYSGDGAGPTPHDDLVSEPPKLPVVCAVPSPFTGGTPAKEAGAAGGLVMPTAFTPVLGSATVPRPLGFRDERPHEGSENDYLVPNSPGGGGPAMRHTLDCRSGRNRDDIDLRTSVSAKQKRFSQSDAYANADDVVYYSQPPLEPMLPPDHPRQGPSRVTNV